MKVAPTLRKFQLDDSFVRLILGPVGSGKSSASLMEVLRRAGQQVPGPDGVRRTRFAIIRNTYSQLRDTTYKTFEQWVPAEIGALEKQSFTWVGRWNDGKHSVECEVLFRALDRPEDVKKLLSLELTGAYINEIREIPKTVLDILETRVGRYPSKAQGGCSWFGIWGDTNPWHSGHWGAKLAAKKLEGYAFFRQPGGRSPDAENIENLPRGYYDRLCNGKDREWIRVYVDGEDAISDVGSIWGSWIDDLEKRGAVSAFAHPMDGVFTSWDLGRADSTAIWFWRIGDNGLPDIIDHYENAGPGLSHYFETVESMGYRYVKHWLPHDARAKTLATDKSIVEQCIDRWGESSVAIGPSLSLADGIAAVRWLLEQPIRIHSRCSENARLEHSGVEALREYRFEWDETNQCFSNAPLHNWASHCFAPETKVLTRNGTCRMDMLPSTGEVMTPCGWKAYRSPRMSKRNAPLVEVAFADGYTVRCTPDHMFLTVDGWKSAESLTPGSQIQSSLIPLPSISAGVFTVAGRVSATIREAASIFTGTSGQRLSGLSLQSATFTTETEILATTSSRTSSAWTPGSIALRPGPTAMLELLTTSLNSLVKRRASGISRTRDAPGTAAMPSDPKPGRNGSERSALAVIAERLSWHLSASRATRASGVRKTAKLPVIASVTRPTETSDVWDITVPSAECFSLANGAVVHNSADAFRYMALVVKHSEQMSRKPASQKVEIAAPVFRFNDLMEQRQREIRRNTR